MKKIALFSILFFIIGCGGSKQTATQTTTVSTGTNSVPVITSLTASASTVQVSGSISLTCKASDADNDALSITWSSGGSGTFSPNPPLGEVVSWTAPATAGTTTISCKVSDGQDSTSSSVTITVSVASGNNSNPTISSGPSCSKSSLSADEQTSCSVSATDPDGDTLSYSWTTDGGTLSGTGSQITYAAPSVPGSYTLTVTVSDGRSGSATGSTTVSVAAAGNTPPTIASLTCTSANLLPAATTDCTASASDPDGDSLNYTWSANQGQIQGNGNTASYTAPSIETSDTVAVTVTDGRGGTATKSVALTIAKLTALAHKTIAAGDRFTCVVNSGEVWCWGSNDWGRLGNGTTINSTVPVKVLGITDAVEVDAGASNVCALLSSGKVMCWGYSFGSTPLEVSGVTNAISIAVGGVSGGLIFFALDSGGVLELETFYGNLTEADTKAYKMISAGAVNSPAFAGIAQNDTDRYISTARDAYGGGHTCIVRESGDVMCKGENGAGQLGDGTTQDSSTYVSTGLSNGIAVEVNKENPRYSTPASSSCAVLSTGEIECWGDNSSGQLGNGTTLNSATPVQVKNITNAKEVTVGVSEDTAYDRNMHTCAILLSGKVMCWGDNSSGQLGNGTTQGSSLPVEVQGLTIASRESFLLALKERFQSFYKFVWRLL